MSNSQTPLRMGRISYLNVLPIYHPLEAGIIPHGYELVSGPPAYLNEMMSQGYLHISSCSCFEYARHPERYYLVRDLSIGSHGPVMSVLLLSRVPLEELEGKEILISGESHTSVALLRLLFQKRYKIDVSFITGQISAAIKSANPPLAFLAIGDEALRLRNHPDYALKIDLAEAWRDWTGLPFIFGLWVISQAAVKQNLFTDDPGELLRKGRDWGLAHMDIILDLTAYGCNMSKSELAYYYQTGLLYNLGDAELEGLRLFYRMLFENRMIHGLPDLRFF